MSKYRKVAIWISMLLAFTTGILFINLSLDTYMTRDSISIKKILYETEWEKVGKGSYLYFLVKRRGSIYLLTGILGTSLAGLIWMITYALWFCFSEGICFTAVYLQASVKGIWCMILLQLPHTICYAFVYGLLIKKYIVSGEEKRTFFTNWLFGLGIMAAGIGMELYLNPWFLNIIKLWLV